MPTIVSHALVPLVAAMALGQRRVPMRLAIAGAILAMVPDLDVLGFGFGLAYADNWGHRGATHSLMFAALLACLVTPWHSAWRQPFAWTFLFMAAASHGLLDMATDGGLGIALFWPFETTRHFFAATPIRVSPIGAGFFSQRGLETVGSEILWIWLPAFIVLLMARLGALRRSH